MSLLMAGILVLLAVGSRSYYERAAVEHIQRQIDTAEEDQVPQLLVRLSALGEPGIRALAASLDDARECVALSARWVLLEQLARWRNQPTAEALRRQLLLAEALCESTPQFGPTGKQSAEQLALRMLLHLPEGDSAQRQHIIEHCRRVLEEVGTTAGSIKGHALQEWDSAPRTDDSGSPRRGEAPTHTGDASRETGQEATRQATRPFGNEAIPAELSRLPGGGLAPGGPGARPVEPFATDRPDGRPVGGSGQSGGQWSDGQSWAGSDLRAGGGPGELASPERLPAPAQRPKAIPRGGSTPRPDAGGGVRRLAGAEDVDAHSLQEPSRSSSAERPLGPIPAGEEPTSGLAGGGKSRDQNLHPVEIEVARRAAHPDPQVRKQLVGLLPQLQAVDSTAWLLRLCEDVDPEVRLEAMTLLATSGNPAIAAQVRKLARQDSNPRIRQLAEQLDRR